jgi:hypothetical protein
MENILQTISNTTLKLYTLNNTGMYGNSFRPMQGDLEEVSKIIPHYQSLKQTMHGLFFPLKPALENLDKNICFLDIDANNNNETFLLSCDWCSICNGIIETAKQNIIQHPIIVKQIDFETMKMYERSLDSALHERTNKITNEETEQWCQTTFGNKSIDLLLFSRIYLKLEMIELRWCPFKRSTEFYYRNQDKRFLEPTTDIVWEVGNILSNHETITCNICPVIVNEHWKYTKSNKQSIFQPLLDYMISEIYKDG